MSTLARGLIVVCALVAVGVGSPALAAPERLNDDVPSAFPDAPEAWAFAYGHETINLEGALTSSSTAHDYFKLRYTFSPKVAASVRYTTHDLNNGFALINPILNNQDSGSSFELDLRTNLLAVEPIPADATKNQAFTAGSAFSLGVSGTFFQLDAGNLGRNENLIKAYLAYSTDLTEEMRAHTYFSSGRLSGDVSSGSVNRIGAGVDYVLIPGDRPLTLMANGILDIYNFREPDFNTSRISRFDVGLRYRLGQNWFASLGWETVNDSENDASGSGIFAGLNYVQIPKPPVECPPAAEETPPAEGGTAPAAAQAPPAQLTAQAPAPQAATPAPVPQPGKQAASAPIEDVPALMAGGGYNGSVNRQASVALVDAAPAPVFEEPAPVQVEPAPVMHSASSVDEEVSPLVEQVSQSEPDLAMPEAAPAAVSGGPYYYDPEQAKQNEQAATELEEQEADTAGTGTEAANTEAAPATSDPTSASADTPGTDTVATEGAGAETASAEEPGGISIPPFPAVHPRHTPLKAVMIRAGLALPIEVPQPTRPGQQMQRAPLPGEEPSAAASPGEAETADPALEQAINQDTYADAGQDKPEA